MNNIKAIIIALTLLFTLNQLSAQTIINNNPDINNRVYLRTGIEPATMLTLGYERKFDFGFLNQNIVSFVEFGSSVANFSNNDYKVGGILPVFEKGKFKIVNNLNVSAGNMSAKNFDSKRFAAADEVAFGIYSEKRFVAFTAEYENIFLNKIEHSDFYKETYFEDAVDGWYKGAGGRFQFGVEGGVTLKKKLDVHLEVKLPFTEKFNSYRGSPMHLNMGIAYRF
jgi:hypothetical protein